MSDPTPIEPLLVVPEAARVLRKSEWSTYELVRKGDLPAVKLGRAVRISPSALRAFIASGGTGAGNDS